MISPVESSGTNSNRSVAFAVPDANAIVAHANPLLSASSSSIDPNVAIGVPSLDSPGDTRIAKLWLRMKS